MTVAKYSQPCHVGLFARLLDGFAAVGPVTQYGKASRRAPTAFFNVAEADPGDVAAHLAARGVNVWNGDNYAYELCTALGLEPADAVRAGLVRLYLRSRSRAAARAWPTGSAAPFSRAPADCGATTPT
jgi:hypothetical protein